MNDKIILDIDIETESLTENKEDALNPHKNRITVIGVKSETSEVQIYRDLEVFKREVWDDPNFIFSGHNLKWDFKQLTHHLESLPANGYAAYADDTRLMAYVSTDKIGPAWLTIYEERRKALNAELPPGVNHREAGLHSLKTLAPFFLGIDCFWEDPTNHDNDEYLTKDVEYTQQLRLMFSEKLKDMGQYDFYKDKAMPWARTLLQAEVTGIHFDSDLLTKMETELRETERGLKFEIHDQWHEAFKAYEEKQLKELQDKYQEMFEKAYAKPTKKEKNVEALQSKYKALYQNAAASAVTEFNLDSPTQMKWLLRDYLKFDIRTFEGDESTGVEVLERLAKSEPQIKTLLEYRETSKILTGFLPTYRDVMYEGKIHSTFNFDGTRTGRLSCIAEGTKVLVPGGEKNIEDIKPGELVYCYNDDNNLTISRVSDVLDQGVKDTVVIKYQSSGDGRVLELICTPDHKLKTKKGEWVEAQNLKKNTKILHARRSLLPNGRVRIYGTNSIQEMEESIIKREYFKASNEMHIHHIDENTTNNSIDNLAICTSTGHRNIHSVYKNRIIGKRTVVMKPVTKLGLYRQIARSRGRLTLLDMDFTSFKRHCNIHGISLNKVKQRYSSSGIYLSKTNVLKGLRGRTVEYAAKALGIGTRKLKKLCWDYGITYNHMVLKVSPGIKRQVYDLVVDTHHNFIAGELCVHNCSNPNLQQVPKKLKPLFRAAPGKKLATYDLGAIEPVVLAYFSQDKALCDLIFKGQSFHSVNTITMFSQFMRPDITEPEVKNEYPVLRFIAKTVGLSCLYSSGWRRVQAETTAQGLHLTEKQCKNIVYSLRDHYAGVWQFKQELDKELESGAVLFNLFGRPFKIDDPDDVYMKGLNRLIQGSASDLCQQAATDIAKIPGCIPVGFIHDSVLTEIDAERSKELCEKIEHEFTKFELPVGDRNLPLTVEGGAADVWE
jgi:DNA polymerase I-like protein with 3'-5' exonuclease and polymerase domains